ncbi:hypothetical protein, partial [Thioclava kandeliae]
PVARQAHNLKVVGSNPTPATNVSDPTLAIRGGFAFISIHQPKNAREIAVMRDAVTIGRIFR